MGHHAHSNPDPSGRLFLSVLLNALITLVEIAGGIVSNSLALISDAIHNLSDTLALILAWVAVRIGKRRPDNRKTFGYQRFEILSAFINASFLTAVSIYLIYEAILRFVDPEPVKTGLMLIIATIGLAANLIAVLFLHRDAKNSLNIKAAYLHLLGDTFSSVAVVAGAILLKYTGLQWIDPALTVVISLVIMQQAYRILHESVNILMQGTPRGIRLEEIKILLEKHPLVKNIHHVHFWQMHDKNLHFEAHIELSRDIPVSESGKVVRELEEMLTKRFGITHSTFQIEYLNCEDTTMIRHGRS